MTTIGFETTDVLLDPEGTETLDLNFEFTDVNIDVNFGAATKYGTYDYNELLNKPSINHVILEGDKTLAEIGVEDLVDEKLEENNEMILEAVREASQTFIHNQMSASDVWLITHNLGKKPSVTVVDSADSVVYGEVSYVDNNTICIFFTYPFSGKAYLN